MPARPISRLVGRPSPTSVLTRDHFGRNAVKDNVPSEESAAAKWAAETNGATDLQPVEGDAKSYANTSEAARDDRWTDPGMEYRRLAEAASRRGQHETAQGYIRQAQEWEAEQLRSGGYRGTSFNRHGNKVNVVVPIR